MLGWIWTIFVPDYVYGTITYSVVYFGKLPWSSNSMLDCQSSNCAISVHLYHKHVSPFHFLFPALLIHRGLKSHHFTKFAHSVLKCFRIDTEMEILVLTFCITTVA